MNSPWLKIPLADYEGHMSLPQVAQTDLLAALFDFLLKAYLPDSVAVLGCAGGNGFDRINPVVTSRIIGADINPAYVAAAADRFGKRLPGLQLIVGDIETMAVKFEPVAMIYAALVFEYVDVAAIFKRLPSLLKPDGVLCTVVQLPSTRVPEITPSNFFSLNQLSTIMRLVSPEQLCDLANGNGLREVDNQTVTLSSGKQFYMQVFCAEGQESS
jgi:SAM-dependent methyltransferase